MSAISRANVAACAPMIALLELESDPQRNLLDHLGSPNASLSYEEMKLLEESNVSFGESFVDYISTTELDHAKLGLAVSCFASAHQVQPLTRIRAFTIWIHRLRDSLDSSLFVKLIAGLSALVQEPKSLDDEHVKSQAIEFMNRLLFTTLKFNIDEYLSKYSDMRLATIGADLKSIEKVLDPTNRWKHQLMSCLIDSVERVKKPHNTRANLLVHAIHEKYESALQSLKGDLIDLKLAQHS